jgi:RNA recognition motif-containing protein
LAQTTTKEMLQVIFKEFGDLERIDLIHDRQTQRSKGFAFIYYANETDATNARDKMRGVVTLYQLLAQW